MAFNRPLPFVVACVHALLFSSQTGSEQTAALHALNRNQSQRLPQQIRLSLSEAEPLFTFPFCHCLCYHLFEILDLLLLVSLLLGKRKAVFPAGLT